MTKHKQLGFTLIELLTVIVILVVILAISVPTIYGMINKSNKSAFASDAKMILKALDYKKLAQEDFDVTSVTKDNMINLLGLSNENYSNLSISIKDNVTNISIIGTNKWEGLIACGNYRNIRIVENQSECSGDFNPPIMTLLGEEVMTIIIGTPYMDAGAIATDEVDGDITGNIITTGIVNTGVANTYEVIYTVSDNAGNKTTVKRIVNVINSTYSLSYTGDYQAFNVPATGIYQIELWGATGGSSKYNNNNTGAIIPGGAGSYTKGTIELLKDEKLYVYIGGKGADGVPAVRTVGGYNGGGLGGASYQGGGGGGGATDVRLVKERQKYRFIRDYLNGSSANTSNHWVEIEVYDTNGNLISGGKNVTTSITSLGNISSLTDRIKTSDPYVSVGTGLQYIELDLGAEYDIGKVKVWHYYADGRTYYSTRTSLLNNDKTYQVDIFNSNTYGLYSETSSGRTSILDGTSDIKSLNSRIMIAAGGGGASNWTNAITGGYAGGLSGHAGYLNSGAASHTLAGGGTQIAGGNAASNGYAGSFGKGGNSQASHGGGGGGGYYGGGGAGFVSGGVSSGAGGSSFISGYSGCNAINTVGKPSNQPVHYTSRVFNNAQMLAGNETIPTYDKSSTTVGNPGNGYALISYVESVTNQPNIVLIGDSVITVPVGGTYIDLGATATDKTDGNITSKIITTSTVNTSVVGNYTVTYEVTNSFGITSNLRRIVQFIPISYAYDYIGDYQIFNVPLQGNYKIELWGARGGYGRRNDTNTYLYGRGAYVSGTIRLAVNEVLYVYVGGAGGTTAANAFPGGAGGWNGGGKGGDDSNHDSDPDAGGGGGGATDIRLTSGDWSDFEGLKTRIMVAAGGGGSNYAGIGGAGGTLSGIGGINTTSVPYIPTQTFGYAFGYGMSGLACTDGGGGAGGGYYGGNTGSCTAGGPGGSSYVSGYTGCDAISTTSDATNIVHTGQPNHYSGKIFTDITMIDGNSIMPTAAGSTMTGNSGSGYAKITYLGD